MHRRRQSSPTADGIPFRRRQSEQAGLPDGSRHAPDLAEAGRAEGVGVAVAVALQGSQLLLLLVSIHARSSRPYGQGNEPLAGIDVLVPLSLSPRRGPGAPCQTENV